MTQLKKKKMMSKCTQYKFDIKSMNFCIHIALHAVYSAAVDEDLTSFCRVNQHTCEHASVLLMRVSS